MKLLASEAEQMLAYYHKLWESAPKTQNFAPCQTTNKKNTQKYLKKEVLNNPSNQEHPIEKKPCVYKSAVNINRSTSV